MNNEELTKISLENFEIPVYLLLKDNAKNNTNVQIAGKVIGRNWGNKEVESLHFRTISGEALTIHHTQIEGIIPF